MQLLCAEPYTMRTLGFADLLIQLGIHAVGLKKGVHPVFRFYFFENSVDSVPYHSPMRVELNPEPLGIS